MTKFSLATALLLPATLLAAVRIEPAPDTSAVVTQPPPAVVTPPPPVETEAQRKAKEQAQLDALRRQQEQIAAETKTLQAADTELAPVWPQYDFLRIVARYQTLKLKTPDVKKLVAQRINTAKQLVDFKTQLIADIAFAPYPHGDLVTRAKVTLAGKLAKATDADLTFTTDYGEVAVPWGDLPPAEVVRLAKFYAAERAASETDDAKSRRNALTSAFAKQYGVSMAPAKPAQPAPKPAEPRPPTKIKPYSTLQ